MSPLSFSSLKNPMWPQIDQTLWTSARTGGGLFDDAGLAAHWRPATIEGVPRIKPLKLMRESEESPKLNPLKTLN